jgi:hypothetical protein
VASTIYKTRRDLIEHALSELKVVAYGQPPGAEEYDVVDKALDSFLAEMAYRDIYSCGNPDAIPFEVLGSLAQALARHMANAFSIPTAEADAMFAKELDPTSPESRLRAITRSRPIPAPSMPDYF